MRARTLNVNKMQRKASEGMKKTLFTSEQKYCKPQRGAVPISLLV